MPKVVGLQRLTKALEEFYLTQHTESISIKKLQEQFDIPLMATLNNRVCISDFDRKMAESCERVLNKVNARQVTSGKKLLE